MSEELQVEEPSGLNPVKLRYYLSVLLKRKWLILGIAVAVTTVATLATMRQPRVYKAATSIIIDLSAPKYLDKEVQSVTDTGYSNYWANKEYYETQHKVITSRAVSQRVVDKLGLANDPAFLGFEKVGNEKARAELMKGADGAALLQSKIKIEPVKDSRLAYIVVEDGDPDRAALLSNEVARAYIDENLALQDRVTGSAEAWLEERRGSLEHQSKSSEMALFEFKKQSDMLTTALEDRQSMVSQKLNSYNEALTNVRLKIAELKGRMEAFRAVQAEKRDGQGHWAMALPVAAENMLVKSLKEQLVTLQGECTEAEERYLENHPKLIACREKLAGLGRDIARELDLIVTGTKAALAEATAQERNLIALLDSAKAEAFEVNKKQIEFDQLKREADNNERLYDVVLKRLKDVELSGLLRTSNVRVLDEARPNPIPVRPNVRNTAILALLLGLLGGVGLSLLLEFLDNTVATQLDVEQRLGLPFLGFIPSIPADAAGGSPDLHNFRAPKSPAAESCRAVRTNLLFMSPDKPFRTLLVTSSGPQEGKSTSTVSLGIAMAQSGGRVLLVDTDMRKPRLHKALGVPNDIGVSSLVVGEGSIDQAIKSTEVPNLFVLPCGPIPPNPAELLHAQGFRDLLDKLTAKFDRILLDSPPVGPVADALVLAAQVSGVMLVLKAGVTNRETARRSVRALQDVGAQLYGAVLNNVDLSDAKYGGYDAYQRYGYYYSEPKDEVA